MILHASQIPENVFQSIFMNTTKQASNLKYFPTKQQEPRSHSLQ